jgi:hypothetical protein
VSVVEPGSAGMGLLGRVRAMLFRPSRAWDAIAEEPTTATELFKSYVAPLAAVPVVCGAIAMRLFGDGIFGVGIRANWPTTLIDVVVGYAVMLASVYLLGLMINGLAKPFGGVPNRTAAMKLAAYSGTAWWVAGVFALYPSIGVAAGMLGMLYSLYTLYLGLPKLMKGAPDQALSYFACVLGAILALVLVGGAVADSASELGGPLSAAG